MILIDRFRIRIEIRNVLKLLRSISRYQGQVRSFKAINCGIKEFSKTL